MGNSLKKSMKLIFTLLINSDQTIHQKYETHNYTETGGNTTFMQAV